MSDLYASFAAVARTLDAQRMGLDVVGQNIANVNTAGYARRTVDLAEVPPYNRVSAGGGVEVAAVRSIRDLLLEGRLWLETPAEQREAAIADSLSVIEIGIGLPGASLDGTLTAFFDAFAQLADDPTSSTARLGVLREGDAIVQAFHRLASQFDAARRDANTRIRAAVDEVNGLAQQIAVLNGSIIGRSSSDTLSLRDQQLALVNSLSEIVDVSIVHRPDGALDVTVGNGRPLVIGDNASSMDVVAGSDGLFGLASQDMVVTSEVTGGRIGGLLQVRDGLIPAYAERLDRLAFAFAEQINALHQAGFNLNGETGASFFVELTIEAGAASAISVDPAVASDPRAVAAAGIASEGDNQVARSIAALREGRVLFGGTATFTEAWSEIVYRVGQDSLAAQQEQLSRAEIVRQVQALRDAVSGVSLDEEAVMMLKFQRAYEANARYFQSVDSTIDVLMEMIGA